MKHFFTFDLNPFKMKSSFIAILVVFLFCLSSCGEHINGNGKVVELQQSLDPFNSIDISGFFEIVLIEGKEGIEVITDENLHEHIDIRVKDRRLVIDTEDNYLDADELTLRIYYKDLNEIDVSGAVELTSEGVIETKSFRLEVSGACDGDLELDAKELEIDISGGGEIDLAGQADRVDIRISGAGEINGLQLKSKDAQIDITGAGEVELDVEKSLDISVTGAGEIRYSGDPEVTKKVSGAGEITQIKK